jgi:hypothetical protein
MIVLRLFLPIFLAALGLSGCGPLRITLLADERTNQGRPLQVVVRSVDEQTYRADSYSTITRLVMGPDGSVLRRLVIDPRPKLRRSFRVKPPLGRPVALYLLYTLPTGSWKMLLLPPLPYSVEVPLRRGGIAVEQVNEHRFRSPDSVPTGPPDQPAGPPSVPVAPVAPVVPVAPVAPVAPDSPALPPVPPLPLAS